MALTSTDTKGFERTGALDGSAPFYGTDLTFKPNTAIEQGDLLYREANTGKITFATGAAVYVGVYQGKDLTTTTNPAAEELKSGARGGAPEDRNSVDSNPNSLYLVTFENHLDFTGEAGSTTTIEDDDFVDTASAHIGGLAYCYEGTHAGTSRIISAYDGTNTCTFTKAVTGATDTTDKWILLDGDASAHDGVCPGKFVVVNSTGNKINNDACVGDATTGAIACVAIHPEDLKMVVCLVTHIYKGHT